MAVTAFRSAQSVTNGTAGTTVVVSKPAGIVDTGTNPSRDHLIAYIAAAGAPTITPPAGWTLITSVASASAVTLWVYRKLASSEGASWTWTLGTSLRNWGWVGAYTGVDPTIPVLATGSDNTLTGSTALTLSFSLIAAHGQGVSASAAVRAATGVATTWTTTSTERADLSTNAGAGIDITGDVGDLQNSTDSSSSYIPTLTASQAQTNGVALSVTLNPYFTPYDGGVLGVIIDAALGADPDGDLSTATWTSLTSFVHDTTGQEGGGGTSISVRVGRPNASGVADPAEISFTLINLNGEFTHPSGQFTRYLVQGLPIRVRVSGFGIKSSYHRATAFLDSAEVRWDPSLNTSFVDVVALGRLSRIQRNSPPLHSAGYGYISNSPDFSARPVAYWPFEDNSGATSASSAIAGVDPAAVSGVTFGASSLYIGSDALATLTAGGFVSAIPPVAASSQWLVTWAASLPAEPAAQTTILNIVTSGTAPRWRVSVTPGASALVLDVFDAAGASLRSSSLAVDEPSFYARHVVFCLAAFDSGADISYALAMSTNGDSGSGLSGTIVGRTKGVVLQATVGPDPGLAGAVFGHLNLYTQGIFGDAITSASSFALLVATALGLGYAGELPWVRFQRLCKQYGVPNTFAQSGTTDLAMGTLGISTLEDLLRETADVEGGLMHDAGTSSGATGLLEFPARDRRDNATVTMTLNFASSQVADFGPILDGQDILNDVEVTRPSGGSARAIDAASIATRGRWSTQLSRNLNTDAFLIHLAQWSVNLGTVPGMRYPQVAINLRASPLLAQQWLASPLSSKILITGPPSQYPPDDMPAFIEGYRENLGTFRWDATLNLSPAAGNSVFVLAQDAGDIAEFLGRLDWDSCVLAEDLDATETAVDVFSVPTITTATDDYPLNIVVGGETMTATAISASIVDSFTRTVSNGWGTSDSGLAWTASGGVAGDYNVAAGVGTIAQSTVSVNRQMEIGSLTTTDQRNRIFFTAPALATGDSYNVYLWARRVDANNYYRFQAIMRTSGVIDVDLTIITGGVVTSLGSASGVAAYAATDVIGVSIEAVGGQVRGRVWNFTSNNTEPTTWTVEATNTVIPAGKQGLHVMRNAGNTNAAPTIAFDLFALVNPQTLTVTRSVNGVVTSHLTGDVVQIGKPMVLAL